MNKKNILIFAISLISIASNAQSVIKRWIIADAKTACQIGENVTSCYKYKVHKDSNWQNFQYEIEGFTHQQGIEYEIELNEEKLKFTEPNGPQYKWTLLSIVSSTKTVITNPKVLMNNKWNLLAITEPTKTILARKAKANIVFNGAENKINGFSGCNTFGGNSAFEDGVIQFGNIESTMKECETNTDIQTKIYECLKGKAAFYVRKNILYIACENYLTLELRPEKSLDSILQVIQNDDNKPKENTILNMGKNIFFLTLLDDKKEIETSEPLKVIQLTPAQQKTILLKLSPQLPTSKIKSVTVTKKETGELGTKLVEIDYKNGVKKEIIAILTQ